MTEEQYEQQYRRIRGKIIQAGFTDNPEQNSFTKENQPNITYALVRSSILASSGDSNKAWKIIREMVPAI